MSESLGAASISDATRPIRVLVVDDHPVVRAGLLAVLEDEPGFEIAGAAGSAEEALAVAATLRPDVVLLDLELPGIDGVEAIGQLSSVSPDSRVVVFTAYLTDEHVLGAVRAGAKGYLLKGAGAAEIARSIRTAHAGGSYLEPRVAARLMSEVREPARRTTQLSEREREVLRLVAEGRSAKQIARALTIAERTVKFHLTSIFNKLGAENRAQAVAIAAQRGLLESK
jgi:DNA-binding NarL/FixJ family response regulator